MRNNGVDRGAWGTRPQKKVLPRIYDRASVPKSTDKGDIHAFAVLARKDNPPAEWDVSTPSHDPLKRWFWYFLKVVGIPAGIISGIIWCIASELGIDLAAVLK